MRTALQPEHQRDLTAASALVPRQARPSPSRGGAAGSAWPVIPSGGGAVCGLADAPVLGAKIKTQGDVIHDANRIRIYSDTPELTEKFGTPQGAETARRRPRTTDYRRVPTLTRQPSAARWVSGRTIASVAQPKVGSTEEVPRPPAPSTSNRSQAPGDWKGGRNATHQRHDNASLAMRGPIPSQATAPRDGRRDRPGPAVADQRGSHGDVQ